MAVEVHPVVLANVADHYTRARQGAAGDPAAQVGVLLGSQSGRSTSLRSSFELKLTDDGSPDSAFLSAKLQQGAHPRRSRHGSPALTTPFVPLAVSALSSSLHLLGWYLVGSRRQPRAEDDLHIHRVIASHVERPLLLILDASTMLLSDPEALPASLFEPGAVEPSLRCAELSLSPVTPPTTCACRAADGAGRAQARLPRVALRPGGR
jgi:hypothetical protein